MSFIWDKLLRPIAFGLDAEHAHEIGIKALASGLASPFYVSDAARGLMPVECLGLKFPNPLGLAAGFDKNALVVDELASLGFGFVEVGTVTLRPQPGNPRPRLFRLPQDQALINRLGFNNDGASVIARRLEKIARRCVIGVNIGRNKDVDNADAVANYVSCFATVHAVADYVTVNVSSPNTPDLRDLQQGDHLRALLSSLQERNHALGTKPLLVKIAPDLTIADIEAIVAVVLDLSIDGIIATNTTTSRDRLTTRNAADLGPGGLSGRPLRERSTEVISTITRIAGSKIPVIGVGGIFSAADAVEKIEAGASLVQAYTGFVYGGPRFPSDVVRGLAAEIETRRISTTNDPIASEI